MITTLRRISPGSAFKVGIIVNGLLLLILGLFIFVLPVLLFSAGTSSLSSNSQFRDSAAIFGTAGILTTLCFYAVYVVVGGVIGGIYFAIAAAIYNVASRWVGGVEIELDGIITTSGISGTARYLDEIERDINAAEKRKLY